MPPGLRLLRGGLFGSERAFGSATAGNGMTAARAAARTRRFATARMGVLRPDHSRPFLEIVRAEAVARGGGDPQPPPVRSDSAGLPLPVSLVQASGSLAGNESSTVSST